MTDTPHRSFTVAALVVAVAATAAVAPVVGATDGGSLDSQEQPQVRLGSTTVDPGETTTVRLATDASDVAGYQANVTFDPNVLQVESVTGTDSFSNPVVNVNNDAGWVFVTQSQTEGTDEPALATITFAAVGEDGDTSSLGFVGGDTLLNDAESTTVDVSLAPGEVTVAAGDAVSSDSGDGSADSQSDAPSQRADPEDGSGSGGPLGGLDPVMLGGGAAVLGGTAAAGAYLGQRLG